MPHDVFISHSTAGKLIAYAICSKLESTGVRCWILPRDLSVGTAWDQSILSAIISCRIMIVVLPEYASRSDRVERQLEIAFNHGLVVIPFQTSSNTLLLEQQPLLDSIHWLDAITPEMAQRLKSLCEQVRGLIPGERAPLLPIHTPAIGQEEVGELSSDSDLASDEGPNDVVPSNSGDVVAEAPGSAFETDTPLTSGSEEANEPEEAALSQPLKKVSKRRPIRALLLTLLPFVIICGLGLWKAKKASEPRAAKTVIPATTPPGPPPATEVQHQDKFAATDPGWGAPDANWTIADGKIRVTPLMNSSAILINHAQEFTNAEISAEIVMTKGEDAGQLGGIIFWAKDYNDCYALVVSADGKFAVGRKLIGRWINPIAKTGNPAINTGVGQMNKLAVRTKGNVLTALINDIQVATLTGEPPQGAFSIGLYGESAETTQNVWDFTNVTVTSVH